MVHPEWAPMIPFQSTRRTNSHRVSNQIVVYSTRLTYPLRILKIGGIFDERLQFVLLVAHVHPFITHDCLERRSFGRVQHKKLAQQILTVGWHVEGNAAF